MSADEVNILAAMADEVMAEGQTDPDSLDGAAPSAEPIAENATAKATRSVSPGPFLGLFRKGRRL